MLRNAAWKELISPRFNIVQHQQHQQHTVDWCYTYKTFPSLLLLYNAQRVTVSILCPESDSGHTMLRE